MKKSILEMLERNIRELNPTKAATIEMNGRSLSSLLTKIKHSKQDLKEVANDEDLLFRAFIEGAQAKWTNNEGKEIRTSLEKFLTDDQMDEIIEQRQAEIRHYIDRLTALEAQFIFIINSRTRKDRREQILKALETFFTCDQPNAFIEQERGETNDSVGRPAHLETLIANIIQRGTGQGRRRGIQSTETRLRDEFMVNTGRNYKKNMEIPRDYRELSLKMGAKKLVVRLYDMRMTMKMSQST
jgi:hypothetical protein